MTLPIPLLGQPPASATPQQPLLGSSGQGSPGLLGRLSGAINTAASHPNFMAGYAAHGGFNPAAAYQAAQRGQARQHEQQAREERRQQLLGVAKKMGVHPNEIAAMESMELGRLEAHMASKFQPPQAKQSPSAVQEWEYYDALSPEDQTRYREMKRAAPWRDLGGSHYNPNTGENLQKTLPPQSQPQNIHAAKAAAEVGKAEGQKTASAQTDYDTAKQTLFLLDQAIAHPGREAATGISGGFNSIAAHPGSKRRDFLTLIDQLKGQNFLVAYQSLKGGGQITEMEGRKAEEAQNRLNVAQSDDAYLKALQEMRVLVEQSMDRAAENLPEGQQDREYTYNPETGEIE